MLQDLMIEDAKLNKAVDTEAIRTAQDAARQFMGGA
jgi:hypothetical protein